MEKTKIFIYVLLALILVTGSASALGISSANFGDVEQGKTYTQTVTLINSANDFDNHFVIEIDGAIKDWIKVSPTEFDLAKGNAKQITLSLEIPKDAGLGELKGSVTAEGKKTVPAAGGEGGGANVGYAVATKGNIYANVIKPGAVASVEIIGVEVPVSVTAGSVAKITVTSKNNGNVATSANFKLDVKKDGKVVASISGTSADFAIGEEKTVKLFWDTQGITDGKYDAYIEATTIARSSEKTTSTAYKPVPITVGEAQSEAKGNSFTLIAVAGVVILIIILAVILKRKK